VSGSVQRSALGVLVLVRRFLARRSQTPSLETWRQGGEGREQEGGGEGGGRKTCGIGAISY
jgi:hypothetical protein